MGIFRFLYRVVGTLVGLLLVLGVVVFVISYTQRGTACGPLRTLATPLSRESAQDTAVLAQTAGYARTGDTTYLTFAEWYIVWSTDEYAAFINNGGLPSHFPYGHAIAQFWCSYVHVYDATRSTYALNVPEHIALLVIGTSFSIEYAARGAYEHTIGLASESSNGYRPTPEDLFHQATELEYGKFLHETPWYAYPFGDKVIALWHLERLSEIRTVRGWERKMWLSGLYGVKALYGGVISWATRSFYAPAPQEIMVHLQGMLPHDIVGRYNVRIVKTLPDATYVVSLPSYEGFTRAMLDLQSANVTILDVAGNDSIVVSALTSKSPIPSVITDHLLFDEPIFTQEGLQRVILVVPVSELFNIMKQLQEGGATVEHVYDFV